MSGWIPSLTLTPAAMLPPRHLVLVALAVLLGLALAIRTLRGLSPAKLRRWRLNSDQRGNASLEFALVLPVIMFLALILTQVTVLMGANMVVNYAAFAATRSAIVWIPADAPPAEPPNTLIHADGYVKRDRIRTAAVFAVVPVSGRSTDAGVSTDQFIAGLNDHFASYGGRPPNWVSTLMADRLRYAAANTTVTLSTLTAEGDRLVFDDLGAGERYTFGPRDPVTVRVDHRLNLGVPYVRAIFADDEREDGTKFTRVSAQYTLTNEGVVDALPPQPELPRMP